jgi:hypothetical protein
MKYALYFFSVLFVCAAGTAKTDGISFHVNEVQSLNMDNRLLYVHGQRLRIGDDICHEIYNNYESENPFHSVVIVQSSFFGVMVYDEAVTYVYN